ncbi:lytic transglycosylase domain-containing protein [Paracoccus endophyticus]|uniref:lytic transglycosylase domain-containing protein n=1 Tax=Paracoccus endophyticus TaxID=2233774 RepID=UPI00197E6B0F|nr:lytic transglycosylase domain-containing protein [Paracoccus endophyticus]
MRRIRPTLTAWLTAVALTLPVMAGAEDASALRRALAAAEARDWTAAAAAAAQSGPIAADLIAWQQLRAGHGTWAHYSDFAARNPGWPGLELLFERGEARMDPAPPAAEVLAWFGSRRPQTLTGARALFAALEGPARAAAVADFWTHTALEPADEAAFLAAWGPEVAPHHAARLRTLLDAGEWAPAERMLALVPGPDADLARARIAVQARRTGVDALILALPAALREDAGLAMDRFRWRLAVKQRDAARALMLDRSTSAEALRDPARWADARRDFARAALRAGDWALAERLAAGHFLPGGEDAVDLDWLAGYAALRAGAADRAAAHFARLPDRDSGPITLSRAHYWRGRAAEAAGDTAAADAAFARAAVHQSAFYGQLAAERTGARMTPALAVPGRAVETLPDWRGAALLDHRVFQAGIWLVAAGQPQQAQRFFLHLAETAAHEDIARMARLMLELHRPWDALRLAKAAAAKGGIYPAAYFPLTGLEDADLRLPPELVLSIARRESEFNHTVGSPAGALGLMQVMPDTARQMARQLGEPFDLARLTTDAAYNARLGAAYLDGLRARFGPSVALVAAGYNAGPGRPARWLRDFGDLRRTGQGAADPVDWVEMIPFDETRTYVMRVAESLPMYRARIAGHPVPVVPSWDLRGGGLMPPPRISPLVLALSDRPRATPAWLVARAAAIKAEEEARLKRGAAAAAASATLAPPAAGVRQAGDPGADPRPGVPGAAAVLPDAARLPGSGDAAIAPADPRPAGRTAAVQADEGGRKAPDPRALADGGLDAGPWPAAPILRLGPGGYALPQPPAATP